MVCVCFMCVITHDVLKGSEATLGLSAKTWRQHQQHLGEHQRSHH